jgi:electron transport complex protein RnfG
MPKSIRLVIAVLVACVSAALGLSLTYAATAPRIAEQDRLAEERSLQAVMPDADDFEKVADAALLEAAAAAAGPTDLKDVYLASEAGAHAGWAIKLASRGYGGPMQLVIGLDTSGSVTGVSILSMNETPGLGTKVLTESWFIEQFVTLPAGFDDADVRALDSISGSTRSANGVRNGVAAAGRVYAAVLSGEEGGAQ